MPRRNERSSPWQLAPLPDLMRAVTRALGWLSALCCILILAFLIHRWSDASGVSVPGLFAAVIALLTDSWQMMALGHHQLRLMPLTPARITVHDVFCLGLSIGDIIMIVLFDDDDDDDDDDDYRLNFNRPLGRERWLGVAVWSLTLMSAWRIYFIICSCLDCYREKARLRERRGRNSV